jgi:protein-L-isoaspartate(D-aspartate) O-methyltransferase
MNLEQARFNMVEQQIRPWDVLDQTILDLLMQVKRENFVPVQHQLLAFTDTEIALTTGGISAGEVMLAPKYDAKMIQELHLSKDHSVLEIGSGSGYSAALLAKLSRHVTTLEINPILVDMTKANLERAGVTNVTTLHQDGATWAGTELFDAIVLSGSVGVVPENLTACLKVGGTMFAYLGQAPAMKAVLITKSSSGLAQSVLFETNIAPLKHFATAPAFVF